MSCAAPAEDEMTIRTTEAEWNGPLAPGSRQMRLGNEAYEGPYDFRSRMGDGKGANPEELLGAAPAGRFSMALVFALTKAGFPVQRIHTESGRMVHSQNRARRGSMGPDSRDPSHRRVRAGCQGELSSVASLVGRRYPSACQIPLNQVASIPSLSARIVWPISRCLRCRI